MTQDTGAAENMTIPTRMPTSQLIPDNIVRMARISNMRNLSGINAKFQFSKVKLRSNKPQLPPYYENNLSGQENRFINNYHIIFTSIGH